MVARVVVGVAPLSDDSQQALVIAEGVGEVAKVIGVASVALRAVTACGPLPVLVVVRSLAHLQPRRPLIKIEPSALWQ